MLSFIVLGPIEIRTPNRVFRPQGTMMQTLLATLLACGERLVRTDALAEELWGATPPAKSDNALQAQISRLRRTLSRLEPDRSESRLITSLPGYRFAAHPAEVDALTFGRRIEEIRSGPDPDPRRDAARLRETLALWRGPVFGGLIGGTICQAAAARYEESRIAALQLLFDLELKAGGHARAVAELTELVGQNPLQEQFCGLLMVALYRSGRQIDALNVYRQLRARLDEELGVEPSPVLRRFELAVLNHDPLLMRPELPGEVKSASVQAYSGNEPRRSAQRQVSVG